jgi:hypothetical protein
LLEGGQCLVVYFDATPSRFFFDRVKILYETFSTLPSRPVGSSQRGLRCPCYPWHSCRSRVRRTAGRCRGPSLQLALLPCAALEQPGACSAVRRFRATHETRKRYINRERCGSFAVGDTTRKGLGYLMVVGRQEGRLKIYLVGRPRSYRRRSTCPRGPAKTWCTPAPSTAHRRHGQFTAPSSSPQLPPSL